MGAVKGSILGAASEADKKAPGAGDFARQAAASLPGYGDLGAAFDPSNYLSAAGMNYLTGATIGQTLFGLPGQFAIPGLQLAAAQMPRPPDIKLPKLPDLQQPLKMADTAAARARLRARAGVEGGMGTLGGTLLTGPGGVASGSLNLGKTMLGS